jgi:5'-methylthioadenosine phosphorylase
LITDYDVGVEGDPNVAAVTAEDVLSAFRANLGRLRDLLAGVIAAVPTERTCPCGSALAGAHG